MDYFLADTRQATDYYPGGWGMIGRNATYNLFGYKYSVNGQEKSTEIEPGGSSMTAEFWQYDSRTGRRWNLDPVLKEFESPYLTFSGNPILFSDPLGNDAKGPTDWVKRKNADGTTSYRWVTKAIDQATTPEGWSYVGKSHTVLATNGQVAIMQDRGKVDYVDPKLYTSNLLNPQIGGYYGIGETVVNALVGVGKLYNAFSTNADPINRAQTFGGMKSLLDQTAMNPGAMNNPGSILLQNYISDKVGAYQTGDPWMVTKTTGNLIGDIAPFFIPGGQAGGAGAAADVAKVTPNGSFYSVAFETKLSNSLYPGVYRGAHFQAANEALNTAITTDSKFASQMSGLGITIPRSPVGSILGRSPTNWVWHHDLNSGIMQLVPKSQHPNIPGGIFWNTMHPNGIGGYAIWGK